MASASKVKASAARREAFPFEPDACCTRRKRVLLQRVVAKPFHCRSDVDVKLLAMLLRRCRFSGGLSSASNDALARVVHFRVVHDGEALFRQGDAIEQTSGRFLVVRGSLLVFSQKKSAPQISRADGGAGSLGECVGSCYPGSICGEDAITGAIARKTTALAQTNTLVAFVTKADYLRVARFNVELEAKVLEDVRILFNETVSHSRAPRRLEPAAVHDQEVMEVIKRFLHRYECFRMLPQECFLRLAQKLQLHAFEPGETLHPALDGMARMLFFLSGECCVHTHETSEENLLKTLTGDRKRNSRTFSNLQSIHTKKPNSAVRHDGDSDCCSEAHDQAPGAILPTHICTLFGGDTFGECYLLSTSSLSCNRASIEAVTLSIPRTTPGLCYAVSISAAEFFELRTQHMDSTDLKASRAHSILLSCDRTCEQVGYLAAYLTRHSSAKLFFSQFPPAILREIGLHATLNQYAVDGRLLPCVQEQGKHMKSFQVVLDGSLAVFQTFHLGDQTTSSKYTSVEDITSRNAPQDVEGSNKFVELVGVLCPGSAFGLLPVLLSSTCPYGYVACASNGSRGMTTKIIGIPAPIAKLCLGTVDEYLVCRPLRALKQTLRAVRANPHLQLPASRKKQAMRDFERFMLHCPVVAGIPRLKLREMIDHMLIVNVPARYFLFEAGEVTKGCIFIVLEGNVRTYRCPVADSKAEARPSIRSKSGAKDISKLVREVCENFTAEEGASTPEETMFVFTKPVDDDFFARDYKFVNDLGVGDGFGHGTLGALQDIAHSLTINRSSNKLNLLIRRATSRRCQPRQQSTETVYPETAITIANCRIGVLRSDSTAEDTFKLDPDLKTALIASMDTCPGSSQPLQKEHTITFSINTRCQIIERMGLEKRLQTHQLHAAAEALKYVEVRGGRTVYRCGEEGIASYFIISGRVRLSKGQRSTTAVKAISSATADDFWSIDLCEGDVFGTEPVTGGISSTSRRLTTAVAVADADCSAVVRLAYLMLDDYLSILSPLSLFSHESNHNLELPRKTSHLQLSKRSTLNSWKAAVYQVTRARPQWTSVLQQACHYRAQLTFDMIHHLPLLKNIPKQCFELCRQCLVESCSLDLAIYERGDELVDQMFLVVEGSVTIQQLITAPLPTSGTSVGIAGFETRTAKVSIQVLRPGDSFGAVEHMLESNKRLVDAIVSTADTKLLRIPKEVYFSLWPQRDRLESKLTTLKCAFDAASPLNPEQLCSMYYSVEECSFKRNEVVFGNHIHPGTLIVLESGICVVHDYITLQRKCPHKPSQSLTLRTRKYTPKLALDTAVATLGPATILFAEKADPIDNTSAKSLHTNIDGVNNAPEGEYIVAESPVVNAFSVELYPRNLDPVSTGPPSRRNQDLLLVALLGHGGLQSVRAAIATQRNRRAESVKNLARLAEAAAPTNKYDPLLSPRSSPLKKALQKGSNDARGKPPMQMELLGYLRDRQLSKQNQGRPSSSLNPLMGPTIGAATSPTKSSGLSLGSFAISSPTTNLEGLLPALRSVGQSDRTLEYELKAYVDPAVVAESMRSAQLVKETRVVAELSQTSHKLTLGPKSNTVAEKRQRHGRPPSRQLESRDRLVDVLTVGPNHENDQKRSGLCRRLLHIKGSEGSK